MVATCGWLIPQGWKDRDVAVCRVRGEASTKGRPTVRENEWVLSQRTPVGDPSMREEQGPGGKVGRIGKAIKAILRGRGKPESTRSRYFQPMEPSRRQRMRVLSGIQRHEESARALRSMPVLKIYYL